MKTAITMLGLVPFLAMGPLAADTSIDTAFAKPIATYIDRVRKNQDRVFRLEAGFDYDHRIDNDSDIGASDSQLIPFLYGRWKRAWTQQIGPYDKLTLQPEAELFFPRDTQGDYVLRGDLGVYYPFWQLLGHNVSTGSDGLAYDPDFLPPLAVGLIPGVSHTNSALSTVDDTRDNVTDWNLAAQATWHHWFWLEGGESQVRFVDIKLDLGANQVYAERDVDDGVETFLAGELRWKPWRDLNLQLISRGRLSRFDFEEGGLDDEDSRSGEIGVRWGTDLHLSSDLGTLPFTLYLELALRYEKTRDIDGVSGDNESFSALTPAIYLRYPPVAQADSGDKFGIMGSRDSVRGRARWRRY